MLTTLLFTVIALASSVHSQSQTLECIGNNLVESIPDDSQFSTLKAALEYIEFDTQEAFNGLPFTIFAPNNAAFTKLLDSLGIGSLSEIDPALVAKVLLTHVVIGDAITATQIFTSPDLQGQPINSALELLRATEEDVLDSLDDESLELVTSVQAECSSGLVSVDVDDDNNVTFSTVNSKANLVQPDIAVCMGLIHEIDAVLVPECIISEDDFFIPSAPDIEPDVLAPTVVVPVYGGYAGYGSF